ncbi:PadR family transcriptional regulator [Streptomyces spinosirectus]
MLARRGRKRRLELEAEYWRLLAAGVGSVEACRQLGIGRKTGWSCAVWGLESGTIHLILARLEAAGWVESSWEEADPSEQGPPCRRYYRLNPDGAERARDALARASVKSATALGVLWPGLVGGART